MEYGLGQMLDNALSTFATVLILVIMEYGLGHGDHPDNKASRCAAS